MILRRYVLRNCPLEFALGALQDGSHGSQCKQFGLKTVNGSVYVRCVDLNRLLDDHSCDQACKIKQMACMIGWVARMNIQLYLFV